MPAYDVRCNFCDYECEISKSMTDDMPIGCRNPGHVNCPGVMEVMFKTPPALTRAACPSRNELGNGTKYVAKDNTGAVTDSEG